MGHRGNRILTWARANTTVADVLLAICLSFGALLLGMSSADSPGLLFDAGGHSPWWSVALTIPLMVRRTHPRPAALAYAAIAAAQLLLGPSLTYGDMFSLIMLYSVLAYGDPRDTRPMIAIGFGMALAADLVNAISVNAGSLVATLRSGSHVGMPYFVDGCDTFWTDGPTISCVSLMATDFMITAAVTVMLLVSVIILAFWKRARVATVRALQERNAALEASQIEERRIASAAERARIARDMHDVVAHTLSTIIIQSDGGRYAGTNDPAVARATMATIRHESERALRDMNRLLDVFGGPNHAEYADMAQLLDTSAATLATVHGTLVHTVGGDRAPDRLSPEAGEAIYRLTQEALTNVRKYAGPGVHVTVREQWDGTGVSMTITDDGRGTSANLDGHAPGYGLAGMRERVASVGGTVHAGPRSAGGFEVGARVPFAASPQSAETASRDVPPAPTGHAAIPESLVDWATRRPGHNGQDVHDAHNRRGNIVERMSQWSERHYWLADSIVAALVFTLIWQGVAGTSDGVGGGAGATVAAGVTAAMCCSLAMRRRFPMAAAVLAAMVCACQMIVFEPVLPSNLLVPPIIYSAVAYGRGDAWKAVAAMACADSLIFGVKITGYYCGSPTIVSLLASVITGSATGGAGLGPYGLAASMGYGAAFGAGTMLICAAAVAQGLWTRSRGANMLILRQRGDALREQRRKVSTMAANAERERISTAMRAEIAAALTGVTDQAAVGLAMLDSGGADGARVPPEAIADAFKAIGDRGREALAHMRQLLSMLRQTESSDERHAHAANEPHLAPVRPLNEQLRDRRRIDGDRI